MSSSDTPGTSWRLLFHALDRTGPAMLGSAFAQWVSECHPNDAIEVVAFRGGPMELELAEYAAVEVILDPHEPWDHEAPEPGRVAELRTRLSTLRRVDANLLISVAAGQAVGLLPAMAGPIVTWSVEIDEDLHWLDEPIGLVDHTDRWLAGSSVTNEQLMARLPCSALSDPIAVVPEFVTVPGEVEQEAVERCRLEAGVGADGLLVLGVGIGTQRKGIDLFLEVAARWYGRESPDARFVWIGGESDPLYAPVRSAATSLAVDNMLVLPSRQDLSPWFAAADVFLHTARADAFPLVCLHASLAGTAVVGFEGTGGTREMMGHAFVGAPYPDVPGLVAQLASLKDADLRTSIASSQYGHVECRYTAEVAAPLLYNELVAAGERRS